MGDGGFDDTAAVHRRNREQYAVVATNYATSASHAGGDDMEWFAGRAQSAAPTRALDVACGGGFSTGALAAAGHLVLATDLTIESVRAARDVVDDGNVTWAVGAAERLPVASRSIGVVGCRIAAHHFASMAGFVDEVARVLVDGGLFLLVDTTVPEDDEPAAWIDDVERMRDPSHGRSWSPNRWRAVLRGARFDVVELTTTRKRHPMEEWLSRSGCVGDRADEVRAVFRDAPKSARAAYDIEVDDDGTVQAYTDTKVCIRSVLHAF